MRCGGCIRGGVRLALLPSGQFCLVDCTPPPAPPPPGPVVDIDGVSSDPSGMTVSLTVTSAPGGAPVLVDWGDGSTPEEVQVGQTVTHTYADPGTYTVTVTSVADPGSVTEVPVEVPYVIHRTWIDVTNTWPTWSAINVPTWNDLIIASPGA